MSKMKFVNELVAQSKDCIESLEELIKMLELNDTEKEEIKEIKATDKTYSLEEVRARLADVSRAGFTDEVRELIGWSPGTGTDGHRGQVPGVTGDRYR